MTTRTHINAERPLHAPLQVFDLNTIAAQTWAETAGADGQNAITLRKSANLRVVLLTMHADTQMHDHDTFAPITLQVISGHVRFVTTATAESVDLRPQMLVTIDGGIPHHVEAVADSVCLLTMGGGAKAT
ncbi:MAG: hypothetical protein NVSMB42_02510 [Herpetosiphon sp.]